MSILSVRLDAEKSVHAPQAVLSYSILRQKGAGYQYSVDYSQSATAACTVVGEP